MKSKKKFWIPALLVTIINFIVFILLYLIITVLPIIPNLHVFDTLSMSLKDLSISDLYMKQDYNLPDKENLLDNRIVIIHSNGTRKEISDIINFVDSFNPAVIGLDYIFSNITDSISKTGTDELQKTFNTKGKRIVTGYYIDHNENNVSFDWPEFDISKVDTGYLNLIGESDTNTIRQFKPIDINYTSFTSKIVQHYNEAIFLKLSKRNNIFERINYVYTNPAHRYELIYGLEGLKNTDNIADLISGNIILVGKNDKCLPEEKRTISDYYFTPINYRFIGKTLPDMYGVEIHAQIISMILNETYINDIPKNVNYIFCFFLVYICIWIQLYLEQRNHRTAHLLFLGFRFVLAVFLFTIAMILFHVLGFNFELKYFFSLLAIVNISLIIWDYIKLKSNSHGKSVSD